MPRQIHFIRHAEYLDDKSVPDSERPLTATGFQQALDVFSLFSENKAGLLAIHHGNLRSKATVAVASGRGISSTQLKEDKRLNYILPIQDPVFKAGLLAAESEGRILSFLVNESDSIQEKSNFMFSSYSKNIEMISSVVLEYLDEDQEVLACVREFMVPCLRAKLTKELCGLSARDNYVRSYEEMRQKKDHIYDYIVTIRKDDDGYELSDYYGKLNFSQTLLKSFIAP